MRKVLVVENGVIVGLRELTKDEAVRGILDNDYVNPFISVPKDMEELLENTLTGFQDRLRQAFFEGVGAERDRAKCEEELGEEVGLVNPYA